MIKLTLTQDEAQNLLKCINVAIKVSDDAINTSAVLLPLASKISEAEPCGEK